MNKKQEIMSPCISICRMNPETGFCQGCWRTSEEIRNWSDAKTSERLLIYTRLRDRKRAAGIYRRRQNRRQVKN